MNNSQNDAPHLLVVDDEEVLRHVLRSVLEEKGCRVDVACSAEEGSKKLAHIRFDAALFDIVLPGRDGLSLLVEAKRMSPDTEVVIMTSQGSMETAMRAIRSGAYDYVLKPFDDVEDIWQTISRAVQHHRLVVKNRLLLAEAEFRNRELNAAVARLSSLIDAGRAMAAYTSLGGLLDAFMDLVARDLDVDRASLMLVDQAAHQLRIGASRGIDGVNVADIRVPLGEGIAGAVALTGKPWLVTSVTDDPRTVLTRKDDLSESFISAPIVLSVPIATSGKVLGVINVTNRRSGEPFAQKDLDYLSGLAGQVAVAIERAEYLEDLQEAYESLKSAQSQLVVSERRKVVGQMAAGVAHDFNNLLSVILGRAELALERGENETAMIAMRSDLDVIRKTSLQAVDVIGRIQDYTRIRKDANDTAVDLCRVVRDAVEMTKPKWSAAVDRCGADVDVGLDLAEISQVKGNANELGQVVSNLVFNAVDAMPNGGKLSLRTAMVDGAVTLEVSDTGIGMDEETRRRVFEPFFTTKPHGQGLGSSIVANIVTRHGGTITVTSRPGAGTTFVVALRPLGDDALEPTPAPAAAAGDNAPPARVLLIDDDDDVRETIEAALLGGGHAVVAFAHAQPALEALAGGRFDLVVTDLTMPKITGFDVTRAVKRDYPDIPVVLLTGWAAERDDSEAWQAGVDRILAKPCRIGELLATVGALVGASASGSGQGAKEISAP